MFTLITGEWVHVPNYRKAACICPVWDHDTQREMFDKGMAFVAGYHARLLQNADTQSMYFSNIDHILHGIRVFIKRLNLQTNPDWVQVIHYNSHCPGGMVIHIDKDGNLDTGCDGFFDQSEIALLELF